MGTTKIKCSRDGTVMEEAAAEMVTEMIELDAGRERQNMILLNAAAEIRKLKETP